MHSQDLENTLAIQLLAQQSLRRHFHFSFDNYGYCCLFFSSLTLFLTVRRTTQWCTKKPSADRNGAASEADGKRVLREPEQESREAPLFSTSGSTWR
jgi:hypothetical protein